MLFPPRFQNVTVNAVTGLMRSCSLFVVLWNYGCSVKVREGSGSQFGEPCSKAVPKDCISMDCISDSGIDWRGPLVRAGSQVVGGVTHS
jgi:hypothetical protein